MNVVIIGAGQAGAWVARRLRDKDKACSITLVGEESWAPYERPPLSKAAITDADVAQGPRFILSGEQAKSLGLRLLLGTRVTAVDRGGKVVRTRDGRSFPYDKLVIATGGAARRLTVPGADLPGVCYLRTWDDAVQLRRRMKKARSMLVVGGGWIGLELAATARKLGCGVTLVESGPRLCARTVPTRVSDFLGQQHALGGVDVRLGCELHAIEAGSTGRLLAHTSQGSEEVDLVAVGIGLQPNVDLAVDCGLEVSNGIVVDAHGRTSDLDIYATGDVANQPLQGAGARIRLESYANATNHAVAVADHILGAPGEGLDIPWFWSDQFDFQLQVLGHPTNDGAWIRRGAEDAHTKFCLFQIREGSLQSVIAVNMARELKLAKRWMRARSCPPPDVLGDLAVRLDRL